MENVYDEIERFYLDNIDNDDIVIDKLIVEGYLRQKAWEGLSDDELKDFWQCIMRFIQYVSFNNFYSLNKLTSQDYVSFILWIEENFSDFSLSPKALEDFFEKMISFHQYLYKKKLIFDLDLLHIAKEAFFPEGDFNVPQRVVDENILTEDLKTEEMVSDDTATKLNFLLEKLLNKIGCYYKNERFSFDFNRAISLYAGPFNKVPETEGEEFWLGFWDYFLFDYHLAESDFTPLRFFYENKKDVLSLDEQRVLNDLLNAKFTIFYITRVVNQYVVECVNLITNEKIQLPVPDYGMHDYKKVLLYGHIYSEGIVMLNYITSVQVSEKLRKRIKEEVICQYKLFLAQQKEASIDEFFFRHAIVVRHIIDILVHLAKVNVGNPFVANNITSSVVEQAIPENDVVIMLKRIAKRYRLGSFSTSLLINLWRDFVINNNKCIGSDVNIAAAIFIIFSTINGMTFVKKKNILVKLNATESEVDLICDKIVSLLHLKIFDSRYLTEEGFVLSLYAF